MTGKKSKAAKPEAKKHLVDVSARLFYAAAVVASREETRYYLNGVYVERHPQGGVLLVATDGHRLVCVRDETGSCAKPVVVGFPQGFPRNPPKSRNIADEPRLRVDMQGILSIPGSYLSAKSAVIDGTYPDWARVVVPVRDAIKEKKRGIASFNAKYLASFGEVSNLLHQSPQPIIRVVEGATSSDPALILFPNFGEAFGVLMPMRSTEVEALPIFMKPILDAADARARKEKAAQEKKAKAQEKKLAKFKKAA